MQFLRTLFWVAVAAVAIVFANRNWTTVGVNLFGGLVADVKLPVLILLAFLVGLLPMLLIHRAAVWRWRRRLASSERVINELRAIPPAVPPLPAPPPAATLLPADGLPPGPATGA